jgi:hypothetical protein
VRIHPVVRRVIFVAVVATWCSFAQAQKIVQSVDIRSHWGGLGRPENFTFRIQRKGKRFLSFDPVRAAQIQALVAALSAPPLTKPEMSNLGITNHWLRSKVHSQLPLEDAEAVESTGGQRQLFQKSFRDPGLIGKVLPHLFRFLHFDDYPILEVEVVFDDGSKLSAQSRSNFAFMLPWNIKGQNEATYNAEISRAVASLLPASALNKDRLAGDELASQLADEVMTSIQRQWNLLGSEERAGEALKTLRTAYRIVSAEIGSWHHPEYGTATYKGESEEMNLHVAIRRTNFSRNVTDALVLRYEQGRAEGVDEFLKSAEKYEGLVFSVPWLNKYIRDHPRVTVGISYVHDKSFGDKAMRVFAADMERRKDLIEQVKSLQADIVLLLVGNIDAKSYWLLFPDKHMMLWRYEGRSGLLNWTAQDFGNDECSMYQDEDVRCSGREVTADGKLAPEYAAQPQDDF